MEEILFQKSFHAVWQHMLKQATHDVQNSTANFSMIRLWMVICKGSRRNTAWRLHGSKAI